MLPIVVVALGARSLLPEPDRECSSSYVERDAQTTNLTETEQPAGLVVSSPNECGGLFFFHLPKTGGSSLQNLLYSQPDWACCFNGHCGACHAECQNKGLQLLAGEAWSVPEDLLRWPRLLGRHRFITSLHTGPVSEVPGLSYAGLEAGANESVSDTVGGIAQLNMMPGLAGCTFGMVTMLRHPVSQLLSAWHYTQDTGAVPLETFAARFAVDALIGVRTPLSGLTAAEASASQVEASIDLAERALWSKFEVVGHTERFDETLLRISDRFGIRYLLAQARPNNVGPCFREGDESSGIDSGEYTAAEWDQALALRPALSSWYMKRLAAFDRETRSANGGALQKRVATLREARERTAAEEAASKGEPAGGKPCAFDDVLTRLHAVGTADGDVPGHAHAD